VSAVFGGSGDWHAAKVKAAAAANVPANKLRILRLPSFTSSQMERRQVQ